LAKDAYLFSNDPVHARPWNPDWVSRQVSDLADEAGVDLNIKKLRHYTASQLLAARFDLQNTHGYRYAIVNLNSQLLVGDELPVTPAARRKPSGASGVVMISCLTMRGTSFGFLTNCSCSTKPGMAGLRKGVRWRPTRSALSRVVVMQLATHLLSTPIPGG
jgi:hypothetical protein